MQKTSAAERYAAATGSSDLMDFDHKIRDVNWLQAAGMVGVGNRLGFELLRARVANDRHAVRASQILLAHEFKRHTPTISAKIAAQTITEHLFDACPDCTGRGITGSAHEGGEKYEQCRSCQASGKRRASVQERAQAVGSRALAGEIDRGLRICLSRETEAARKMNRKISA